MASIHRSFVMRKELLSHLRLVYHHSSGLKWYHIGTGLRLECFHYLCLCYVVSKKCFHRKILLFTIGPSNTVETQLCFFLKVNGSLCSYIILSYTNIDVGMFFRRTTCFLSDSVTKYLVWHNQQSLVPIWCFYCML